MARANNNYNDEFVDDMDGDGSDGRSLSEQIDLQHYLRILRKHKWPITLFTAAVTALAAYYAYTATPIYSATSTLLIEQQKTNIPTIEELYGVDNQNTDYYQTQFELLKSRSLAERVITTLNLWDHPELSSSAREALAQQDAAQRDALGEPGSKVTGMFSDLMSSVGLSENSAANVDSPVNQVPAQQVAETATDDINASDIGASMTTANGMSNGLASVEPGLMGMGEVFEEEDEARKGVIGAYLSRMSVAPVRKTKLVKLSFESSDPVLAATVANTIGEEYINSYLEAKLAMTTKASSWLSERLAILKQTLDESEQRLISFKQANGLVDVDGSVNRLNEQELLLDTTELVQARSELASVSDIYQEIRSLRSSPELLETVPGVQSDPLVQRTKIEQGSAQRQLDELQNIYGEKHPRIVDAKSQLNTLNASLQGHVLRVVNSIEKDYQLKRQRVATIQAKLATGKQDIQNLGTKKFELDALEREVATNQDIYDTFFNRMSEARSADGLETANARVSDIAVPPAWPVKPKKQLIIALAALASLVLSMLMAFLYEQMDDTVKSTNDIEGKLGMKLLGIFPLVKTGVFGKGQDLPLNPTEIPDKKGTFAEAVSTARTAICMEDGEEGRKVIMVTSSVPGEGKSTVSINLSYSLAQLERVLLIDCDMRRPTIAKAAGMDKNAPGLSSLITNTAAARDCIVRGAFGGAVDILPSGPIPDQPLELLSSKRFEKILEQLGHYYDRIVIDSAPTQAVSDALVLSKHCDALVYAVKSHDTSLELVKRGLMRLRQVHAPIAGVLITQVDIDKITSYGGDYYYQGYYDYYGYTEKGSAKKPGKLRLTQEELISIKNDDADVNLDLDYDMDGPATGLYQRGRSSNGGSNLKSQNVRGRGASRNQEHFDEFDMTTQMDSPVRQPEVAGVTRAADRNKRFTDDLDIL